MSSTILPPIIIIITIIIFFLNFWRATFQSVIILQSSIQYRLESLLFCLISPHAEDRGPTNVLEEEARRCWRRAGRVRTHWSGAMSLTCLTADPTLLLRLHERRRPRHPTHVHRPRRTRASNWSCIRCLSGRSRQKRLTTIWLGTEFESLLSVSFLCSRRPQIIARRAGQDRKCRQEVVAAKEVVWHANLFGCGSEGHWTRSMSWMQNSTHSLTRLFTLFLTRLLFSHSLAYSLTHLLPFFTHSHSLDSSLTHSHTYPLTLSHSHTHSLLHLLTRLLTHSLTHFSTPSLTRNLSSSRHYCLFALAVLAPCKGGRRRTQSCPSTVGIKTTGTPRSTYDSTYFCTRFTFAVWFRWLGEEAHCIIV